MANQDVPNAVELENHVSTHVENLEVSAFHANATNDVNGNITKEADLIQKEVPKVVVMPDPDNNGEVKRNCKVCKEGFITKTYTVPGILWLVICLPVGWICFLTKKKKKCDRCDFEEYPDCCFG